MGWQNEDWASIDDIEMDEEQMRQLKPLDMEEVRHMDPYTIHRHPVYISSSALYKLPTRTAGTPDAPQPTTTGGSFGMGILCQFGRWGKAQFFGRQQLGLG